MTTSRQDELEEALKKVSIVKSDKERSKLLKGKSIILTTSGMLTGGPVLRYLKYMRNLLRGDIIE